MSPIKPCNAFSTVLVLLGTIAFGFSTGCQSAGDHAAGTDLPVPERGLLLRPADFPVSHARLAERNPDTTASFNDLIAAAEEAMELPIRPVTAGKENGERVAPSGDPRDYVSLSPYWWPDPDSPTGEPYIRRDGVINPDRHEYDTPKLGDFGHAVRTLAFAYSMTGDERYAERAIEHVRAWFVTPETRMNPVMKFAQFVPGVSLGRAVGIIDTNRLRFVPDSLYILAESPAWTARDTRETRRWFEGYATWLMTSDLGIAERNAKNNHGTWFDAQTVQYALYAGREDIAREVLDGFKGRMDLHFESDGSQPHELARTRALDYTDFNIRAYLDLMRLAETIDIDLRGTENANGATLKDAITWAVPYFTAEREWPYEQISPPRHHMYYQHLRIASKLFDEPAYERAAQRLPNNDQWMPWVDLVLPAEFDIDSE